MHKWRLLYQDRAVVHTCKAEAKIEIWRYVWRKKDNEGCIKQLVGILLATKNIFQLLKIRNLRFFIFNNKRTFLRL